MGRSNGDPNINQLSMRGSAVASRQILAAMLFLLLLSCAESSLPKTDSGASIEQMQFMPCPNGGDGYCEASQKQLAANWSLALKGDYQSQRNVAYAFGRGQDYSAVSRRPIQACAWRMVITASGSNKVDSTDLANYETDCARLTADDFERAKEVAELITRRVYGTALGAIPALPFKE